MRIGHVVGKVVLSRVHPSLVGAQFKIVLPLTFSDLAEPDPVVAAQKTSEDEDERGLDTNERVNEAVNRLANPDFPHRWGNEIVVYDDCSAAIGEWLAFSGAPRRRRSSVRICIRSTRLAARSSITW